MSIMSKYNEQYYLAFNQSENESAVLFLKVTADSAKRKPGRVKLSAGEQPIYFEDAFKDINIEPSKAHLNLSRMIVNKDLYVDLIDFQIKHFQLYPAVVIDRYGKHHEDYWFFNSYEKLHVVELGKSVIDSYAPSDKKHDFIKYSLSDEVLDAIPEEERLVLSIAESDMGAVLYHQKIIDIFNKHHVETIKFIKVSEWESGSEF